MKKNTIFRYVLLFFFPLLVSLNSYALDCAKIVFKVSNTSLKYCVGQEINLQTEYTGDIDGGIVTYEWYEPNNNVPIANQIGSSFKKTGITNSQEGVYKCIMKVTKGSDVCPKEVTFDVKVINQFSFDLGTTKSICPGSNDVDIAPTIQNSNNSIVYSWTSLPAGITGTDNAINITKTQVPTEATLTLTATAGNCVFSDNVKVVNLKNLSVSAGSDQIVCKGGNSNLSANIVNNLGYSVSFNWTGPVGFSSNNQNISLFNLQQGSSYTIKANVLQCQVSAVSNLNLIDAIITSDYLQEGLKGEILLKNCTVDPTGNIKIKNGISSALFDLITDYEVDWGDGSQTFKTNVDNQSIPIHIYNAGFYILTYRIKTTTNCIIENKYKVFVGKKPGPPDIETQKDPDGCIPRNLWFKLKSNDADDPTTLYKIIFSDGNEYEYEYGKLPDTIWHAFKQSSCGFKFDIYKNTHWAVMKSLNSCDTSGVFDGSWPIYISEPLKADLDIPVDTICINRNTLVYNKTIGGITAFSNSCNTNYKHFWEITPNTGWTTSSNLGLKEIKYLDSESGDQIISLNFQEAGLYHVKINAISNSLCPEDSKTKTICVEDKPIPKFELDKLTGCAPFTPIIKDLSDISKSCRSYRKWEIFFNSTPCSASTGNYEFINGTSASSLVPKIKFNTRGNYTIRLKLANTCDTVWYDQQIKVLGLPIVSIPLLDSICLNSSISPTATVNLCDNTISGYAWIFNTGSPATSTSLIPGNITYNSTGLKTIQLTVKSACGDAVANQTVYVKPLPPVLYPRINNLSPTVNVCIGDNANFTSGTMPQTPATYSWTGPNGYTNTNQNFSLPINSVSQDGIYKVKGTMNGCAGPEESVTLVIKTKPTLTITPSSTEICKNLSTDLEAFGETSNTPTNWKFTWTPTTNIIPTLGSKVKVSPLETTTYTVKGEDGTCSNTKTVTVTVKELPSVNNSNNSQTICSETAISPVTWTSTMASTYSWSISSNTGNITGATASGEGNLPVRTLINPTFVDQTLKYTVIPKSNGCDGPAFEYTIVVKPKPNLTISPFTKTTYCGGEKITVPTFTSSVAGATFQWTLTTPNPVPSVITVVTTNQTGTGQMTDLTINNSGTDPVAFTYTVKSIANVCEGTPSTFSFTIFPAPSIQPLSKTTQEICSETNSEAIPFSSLTANVKYIWKFGTIPTGLSAPSKLSDSIIGATSFSIPSFPFTNSTANPLSVDVIVKAATLGTSTCPGQTRTHTITVNPKPNVTPSTPSQLICNTQNTTAINFSSTTPSNVVYNWTNSNTTIGLAPTGTGNIATFVAANSTKDVKVATITVTPIYSTVNKTCNGVPSNAIIKVLPTPEVNPITSQVKCPLDNTDEVTPNINPSLGSTFSWALTGDKPNIASALSGTGAISSVVAENSGATIKTGTYNVTPTFTFEGKACTGPVLPFTIKVLPKPSITPISNQEKCSNTNNDPVNFVTSPATDVVINWQNDLAIGIPTPGTGNISSMKLTNATTSPVTSNFTASPSFTNSGKTCVGDDKTFTIKVNPIPKLDPISDISICPQFVQPNIAFISNVSGTTFGWTTTGDNIGISGTVGTGNIAAFTSVNTSDVVKTATVQVTPTASVCPGTPVLFKINVKPKPRVTNSPLAQEVCSGVNNKEVVWTSSVTSPTPTYTWTSLPLTSGLTITPATGNGNIPASYSFVNTGTSPIAVKFTVTNKVDACESDPTDYTLTINPRPVLSSIASQVICSGASFTTPTFTSSIVSNTTYAWAIKTSPAISPKLSGYVATGTGLINGVVVTNSDNLPQSLVYTITPSAYTCSGDAKEFSVLVNPTPQVTFSLPDQTICNNVSTQKVTVTPQPSDATISWTATLPTSITGFTTLTGTGEIPDYVLSNATNLPAAVSIEAKASTTGSAVCPGSVKIHSIHVVPTPKISPTSDITKCANDQISAISFTGTATSFDWVNSSTIVGLSAATGIGNIPLFTTINGGTSPIKTTISVTPKYTLNTKECQGLADQFDIEVNPRPILENLSPLTYCNKEIFPVKTFASNISSTTYKWDNSDISIGLGATGITSIPTFTAVNNTASSVTATISVTPTFTNSSVACDGAPKSIIYTVKPTAKITNTDLEDTICSGELSKSIVWNTNITATGTSYTWKLINTPDSVSGHALTGTSDFKSVKIFNTAKTIRSLVYRITPTYAGCIGDTSFLYTLFINPSPGLKGVSDQTICGGTSTVASVFISDVAGTVFKWKLTNKAVVPATISNYVGNTTDNGTGDLKATIINNSGSNPFDLLYEISTNGSTGCGGASQLLKITVNPAPTLNPISPQTICSGQNTAAITLASSTPNVSFIWNVVSGSSNVSGVNTLSGTISSIPVFTLTHTKLDKQTIKLVAFSKTEGLAVCDGKKDTIYIHVNPIPELASIADQVICKDENTTNIVFNGNGTDYTWTVANPAIGLASNHGKNIGPFKGINNGTIPVSSSISVLPEFMDVTKCVGTPKLFNITVNPKPLMDPLVNKIVCHQDSVKLNPFKSSSNGVYFKWYNTTNAIGLASSGTGNISPFKGLNVSTTTSLVGNIKVVPFFSNLSKECKGDTANFYIKVNPIPTMTQPGNLVLCNDSLTKKVSFTGSATSYNWFNDLSAIGLAPSGIGEIPAFKSLNTTTTSKIANVKVLPIFTEESKSCFGDTLKFTYTIHPTPQLIIPLNDTLCYNQNTKEVVFNSTISTASYQWNNITPLINSGLPLSGTNKILSFKGLNNTNQTEVSIVNIVATANQCPSKVGEYKIVINPRAKIIDTPVSQEVCSGVNTKEVVWKSDIQNGVTSYTWSLKANPYKIAITKIAGQGNILPFTMLNDSSSVANVSFNVVPNSKACSGDTFVYTFQVLPRPKVNLIPAQSICGSKAYVSPVFSSDVINTVFNWKLRDSLLVPASIKGYLKSGSAAMPAKIIDNTGVLPYTLVYDVTTDGAGCSGQSIAFNLTINPAPSVAFSLLNQTICNATTFQAVTISSSTPNVFFEWKINSIPDSIQGFTKTSGSQVIDPLVLTNSATKPLNVIIAAKAYTKAATESCYGKDSLYTITVNPVAKAKPIEEQLICHGSLTNVFEFKGVGTSFHWNTPVSGIGLKVLNGEGNIPPFIAIHPDSGSIKKVLFTVLPKYTFQNLTCAGILDTFYLSILPKPIIEVTDATICLGKKATLEGRGAAFSAQYAWSPATGLSCNVCPKPVATPTITTKYTIIGTNRYTCKDTTETTVFVNPLPKVYAGPDTTLCNQPIAQQLIGTVEGVVKSGNWSGSPDLTKEGIYTPKTNGVYSVVYNFILPTGCENFDTTIVTVKDVTKADAGPDLIACFNDPDVQLNGIPQPGTWTGFNVSTTGVFKPIKDTLVPLVFTIGKGTCLNRDTMLFKVHPDFTINAGADKEFCFSDPFFDFVNQFYTPTSPKDKGEWKGNGITDPIKGSFKASIAGVGKHPIVFSYTHPITGCVKRDTLIAEVHPLPEVKFSIDSIVCLNTTHTILNQTNYLGSSKWSISPKTSYTDKNPTHKFDSVGFFDIRLIATSPFGCIDSLTKNIEVREGPTARFTRTPDSTCGLVSFTNLSKGIGVNYLWDFGNGKQTTVKDPADLIYNPGIIQDTTYQIQLRIENLCGADSMKIPVVVKPVPKIIFAPNVNEGCSVLPIVYANKTVGLPDEIKWDFFGDGNFVESKDSLIYKNYTTGLLNSTTYNIKVIAVNECGSDTAKTTILVHPNTVKAHFNPDRIEGCTDLSIKFTQYSMGNTFHIWNFGDGTSSKDIHPTHVYSKPGKYNVYLAVSNGCSKDTMRATINVYQTPKIDFVSSKDSLCLKGAFAFKTIRNLTDQFTYRWIFGDGDTSFVENPTHTYLNAGKYTINLQVSNVDNYCSASVEHPVYVKPRPVAAFSMDTTQGCSPVLVKFKNKSIGANFHSWNYGDGTITNVIESDHLFKTVLKDTIFEVKLIVENASSCKDTFTSKVHVFPLPTMNFTYTPSDQCYTPMYADFTNTSIGAQSYKWYFHDNMTSVELNPTMVYKLPGKYIVKLEGENEFRCMSNISHEVIKYPKPKADFTSDKKDGCVPLSISLTNKSQGASKYSWDFGDGNAKNTTDATTIYPIAGKYNIRLIVENSDKCKDTLILPIEAFPVPTPNFVFQRSDTCATPMVTNFTNTSTGALYYDWDFDNGLVATITNPKTTYTIPKDYNVKLIATNEYNCSISIQKTVTLLQKPAAEFTTNINIGCIPLVIDFKNTSTFGKYYSWEFDDGNVSNQQDTKHIFKTSGQDSIKKFQVKLIVEGSNGCKDTIEHAITTMPLPVPNFTYMTTDPCYNPMNAYFQNNSLYAKKYDWIFGNGQLSTETNPAANYLKAGVYNVDLIATNKFECKDTIRKTVQMNQKPKAQFSMDKDKGCIPLSVSFLNESLNANYSKWNFDDGNNSANTSTNNLFTKVGELNIELIVENTLGCKDTVRHKLTTFPIPVPAFNFTTTDPCYIPMITQFNNQSTGAVGYAWNFGNNQTSNLDNPSVKYDASNIYKVKLDAINEYACTTSVSKFVTVNNRPKSDFYSDKVEGCMPLKVDFTNKSIGYKFLNWNFGDTNYSTAENPNHVFLKDGKYQINLVTENSIGCKDTIAKTILVHPLPVAKFSITNSDPCFQPMEVKTYNQSTGATNYDWDFGDAITSFETHPIVNYTTVNNHLIVLNAKNEYGCLSTAKQFIRNYHTPKLTPKELPSGFCEWDQLFYSINSLFVNKITWDMGNGAKKEGGTINYTYKKQGNYTITVIGEGEGGCADTVVLTQQIIVHPDPVADFNAEGIKIDDLLNGTMVFKNASKQADYYTWFFGDGDTSNVISPTHKFHHSGDFSTTLIATNSYKCVDTITKTIHVDFFKGLYVANAIYLGHQDFQVSHFLPKGVGLFEYEITIYDDWGNLIWRSTAIDEYGRPTEAWDGTYKGEFVQQDSYVWKVNAIFRDNSVWEGKEYQPTIYKRAGTVTVIK